jgi:hypothetical protein
VDIVLPTPFVEDAVFSLMYVFDTFVENHMARAAWVYFWVLYSVSLIYVTVFEPVPCCFCSYGSVVQFEIGCWNTSSIVYFPQNNIGYSGCFVLPYEFWDCFVSSVLNVIGILMWIALNQ